MVVSFQVVLGIKLGPLEEQQDPVPCRDYEHFP